MQPRPYLNDHTHQIKSGEKPPARLHRTERNADIKVRTRYTPANKATLRLWRDATRYEHDVLAHDVTNALNNLSF